MSISGPCSQRLGALHPVSVLPWSAMLFTGILCLFAAASHAAMTDKDAGMQMPRIKKVLAVGPSWASFTNLDGTGLYHEMLDLVFGRFGITVKREYMPSVRGRVLVAEGRADLQTCYAAETIKKPLLRPRYPMYVGMFHVFFTIENVPQWAGVESMRNRTVVWRKDYYNRRSLGVPVEVNEVRTGVAALRMVLLGRADFYLDDPALIRESIHRAGLAPDGVAYRTERVGMRRYYPIFSDTPRGRAVMALYEKGMETAVRSGELRDLFIKWGQPYPDYNIE